MRGLEYLFFLSHKLPTALYFPLNFIIALKKINVSAQWPFSPKLASRCNLSAAFLIKALVSIMMSDRPMNHHTQHSDCLL